MLTGGLALVARDVLFQSITWSNGVKSTTFIFVQDGDTALTIACSVEQIQIVQLLLKARANSNHLTKVGIY